MKSLSLLDTVGAPSKLVPHAARLLPPIITVRLPPQAHPNVRYAYCSVPGCFGASYQSRKECLSVYLEFRV